jgi:hypothetical protein
MKQKNSVSMAVVNAHAAGIDVGYGAGKPALHASVCCIGHRWRQPDAQGFASPCGNAKICRSYFRCRRLLYMQCPRPGAVGTHAAVKHHISDSAI